MTYVCQDVPFRHRVAQQITAHDATLLQDLQKHGKKGSGMVQLELTAANWSNRYTESSFNAFNTFQCFHFLYGEA